MQRHYRPMQQKKYRRRAGGREDDRHYYDQAIEIAGVTHEVLPRGKQTAARTPSHTRDRNVKRNDPRHPTES
jgi:hypothetical protein